MMTSVSSHLTPLRLVQPATIDLSRVGSMFADESLAWLGTPVASARPGSHRYLTDLSLPIREHAPSLVFKKAAYVDLGDIRQEAGICELEIGWQSSTLAPLFPVFAGHLTLTPTELRLEGYYAPPGGEFGAVLDKAFLGIAARGTARWFLEKAAAAIAVNGADAHAPSFQAPATADGSAH